ncbi:hypothetical protein BD626DRAFT_634415, partial [Schizophyllum amplum]
MLNDWDLAETDVLSDVNLSPPPSNSRRPPGTPESLAASTPPTRSASIHFTRPLHPIPFAAIDLLKDSGQRNEIHHLYRHDLEALVWVLVWMVCCYEDGTRREPLPTYMREWVSVLRPDPIRWWTTTWVAANPHACRIAKHDLLYEFSEQIRCETWTQGHILALLLL